MKWSIALLPMFLLVGACGNDAASKANVELRKEIQDLKQQLERAQSARSAAESRLLALEQRQGVLPTLPQEKLARLFTTHGLSIGRLTGGVDLVTDKPGDEALVVHVAPVDREGAPIKAAGAFVIEAFALADNGKSLGRWEYSSAEAGKLFNSQLMLYNYVFTCRWQTAPTDATVVVQVTMTDELTGAVFSKRHEVKVNPPR